MTKLVDAWTKAIPEARDRAQSRALVAVMVPVLAAMCVQWTLILRLDPNLFQVAGISLTFAVLVRVLRAATLGGALSGGMICMLVCLGTRSDRFVFASGLAPLVALFVLTFASTRAGRARKNAAGLAEERTGRSASQVIANLGVSGIIASGFLSILVDRLGHPGEQFGDASWQGPVLLLAALAEASADTVSSEIGQAFGGPPILLSTLRTVAAGTDGAVSLLGTVAGVVGACVVAVVGMWGLKLSARHAAVAFGAGVAGLLFDSVLGATIERRGWLGNDLVNFISTFFAVVVALLLLIV